MTKVIQIPKQQGQVYAGRNLAAITADIVMPHSDDEEKRLQQAGVRYTVSDAVRRQQPPVITKSADTDNN